MTPVARLILLEDESDLREELAALIVRHGHAVREAGTLAEFRAQYGAAPCDVAIIDRVLPDGDGIDLVTELRTDDQRCGIIMLTALDASSNRIEGYQRGADHYLGKPIRSDELLAVIDTLAWRLCNPNLWRLESSNWTLHTPVAGDIELTSQEFCFLQTLARSPKGSATRNEIVRALGKDPLGYETRNLDALLKRLRKKVLDAGDLVLPVKTVHGTGFALTQSIKINDR